MQLQALDRKFSVNFGDNNIAVGRLLGAIDNHDVAIAQPEIAHAVAAGADKESRGAPADAEFIQVQLFLNVICRRRGKPCGAGLCIEGYPDAGSKNRGPEQCQAPGKTARIHDPVPGKMADLPVIAVIAVNKVRIKILL
ncbi:hypothetical protein HA46_19420 [Pantoea septica]|uniref:Uncharacterized protein n=1 Tax=Pantoea septica TaxID=472695 RepID=A0ABX3UM61_9GAMM|nr:hypothetical protein HA46_19420 [Pantoea septica]